MKRFVSLGALLGLGALIVGPAPGATGGCGAQDVEADFVASCVEFRSWDCVRKSQRGDLDATEEALQSCVDEEAVICEEIGFWRTDCQPYPTHRDVDNCVEQLQRADTLLTPFDEIPECDFCP